MLCNSYLTFSYNSNVSQFEGLNAYVHIASISAAGCVFLLILALALS